MWDSSFFLFLFKSSIVLQRDCQLLYYQPNCFQKKKKRIIKRISLKGHFSRLVELKLDLPAVFWFVGTCLHMTGTWKYHTLLWQFAVLVSREFWYGSP